MICDGKVTFEDNVIHDNVTVKDHVTHDSNVTLDNKTICGDSVVHDIKLIHLLSSSDDN
jgi:hypothetical protein